MRRIRVKAIVGGVGLVVMIAGVLSAGPFAIATSGLVLMLLVFMRILGEVRAQGPETKAANPPTTWTQPQNDETPRRCGAFVDAESVSTKRELEPWVMGSVAFAGRCRRGSNEPQRCRCL